MSASFDAFERAFRGGVSGFRRTCECGIEYWDGYNSGYDLEDGEAEQLEKMRLEGRARSLPHSVGVVEFEGRYYVDGCDCWHPRAERVIQFLNEHAVAIAEYLTLEKKRKQREAEAAPVVQ